MATLHLFGGEKGGVGKTFVTKTAIQWHLDQGIDFALFDADNGTADVKRIYPECHEIIFSSKNEAEARKADSVYYAAENKTTLVNLPPHVLTPLSAWFEKNSIIDLADQGEVEITHWFIYGGNPSSIRMLDRYLSYFQGKINHVLVKNPIPFEDCIYLDKNEDIQQKIRDYRVKILNFPKLSSKSTINKMDRSDLNFGEARESKDFNSSELEQIKSFLESAYSQFDNVGVFQ